MKKLSLLFLVLSSYSLRSQTDTTYIIKPGENIFDVVLLKDIYRYPGFMQGTVLFRDGRSVRSRLNYNMLISQVQFIDMKGDTLSLAEEETIKYVVIAQDSFCYDDGYIELMVEDGKVRMGRRIFFKEFEQKPGAYGLSSGTTAAVNLSSILERRAYELNTEQELVLAKSTTYFLGNKNEILPAEKKNVVKLFPRHKKAISDYINNKAVNFDKEEDLIRLTSFLQSL